MKVNSIGNNYGLLNLYSSMFQNNTALSGKLYKDLFPTNNKKDDASIGEGALSYVKNIKASSQSLSKSISKLSGMSYTGKTEEEASKAQSASKSAVEDFVKNYNDLYSEAVQKADDPKAQKLATRLLNISKTYSGSLAGIGVGFDSDGRMKIDEKALDAAAGNGKLETFFTQNRGKNYGFTNQLANIADSVSHNTSAYVSSSVLGNSLMDNFSYSALGKTSQYSFLSAGWLFDYLY